MELIENISRYPPAHPTRKKNFLGGHLLERHMMLRMFPRRPKLPQINISTPRIQNLREDVRYSIWRIFSANFFAYNLAESKYFFYSLPNTISTGDLVEFLCRHFPDYVETLPVFYIILWLLGLSGSFLDYPNSFQIFRTPSGQARKKFPVLLTCWFF